MIATIHHDIDQIPPHLQGLLRHFADRLDYRIVPATTRTPGRGGSL